MSALRVVSVTLLLSVSLHGNAAVALQASAAAKTDPVALTSFLIGAAGFVIIFSGVSAGVAALTGLLSGLGAFATGLLGLIRIRRSAGSRRGRGWAYAGLAFAFFEGLVTPILVYLSLIKPK